MSDEMPDELWCCKKNRGYNGYEADTAPFPSDTKYIRADSVVAQNATCKDCLQVDREKLERVKYALKMAIEMCIDYDLIRPERERMEDAIADINEILGECPVSED